MQNEPLLHPAIERFAADALAEPSVRAVYVFGSAAGQSDSAPLDYPDRFGAYYGYDSRTLPLAGLTAHNIKGLVALVCWIATLRLARERGIMAASKPESVSAYATDIGDEWTSFVEDTYRLGHDRWHYLVPDDS